MSPNATPHCFGDPAEYHGEQSRECKSCSFRVQCGNRVDAQANSASRRPPPMPSPAPRPQATPPPRPAAAAPAQPPPQPTSPTTRPTVSYPHRTYAYSTTSTAQPVATSQTRYTQPQTVTAASALIRPAKFNHQRPLLPQYATYVGYDVAEVIAQRAVDLIQSCREEYARSLFEEDK